MLAFGGAGIQPQLRDEFPMEFPRECSCGCVTSPVAWHIPRGDSSAPAPLKSFLVAVVWLCFCPAEKKPPKIPQAKPQTPSSECDNWSWDGPRHKFEAFFLQREGSSCAWRVGVGGNDGEKPKGLRNEMNEGRKPQISWESRNLCDRKGKKKRGD